MVMRPNIPACVLGLLSTAGLLGACSPAPPEEPDYLRVVVDIDARLKGDGGIDNFRLKVDREGSGLYNETYDQSAIAKLPDSLVIDNPHPNNDSPDTQLFTLKPISVSVIGYTGGTPRIWRTVRMRFNTGQKQLGLPMCWDCLDHECPAEQTCINGACVDWYTAQTATDDGTLINPLKDCSP